MVDLIWHNGKLFGIAWSVWKVVGWLGNVVFFSRFFVQWYATEKRGQVTVPSSFWWISLIGSFCSSFTDSISGTQCLSLPMLSRGFPTFAI